MILWDSLRSVVHPELSARYHASDLALNWEILLKWPFGKALRFLLERWKLRLNVLKNFSQLIVVRLDPEMIFSALGHIPERIAWIKLPVH